jgi:replicative DNA helicase
MDTQPTLEDLRGSSSIAQEADTVLLLWRESKRKKGEVVITNNVNVSVQANRRTGKTGNVKMIFENGHFLEQEWKTEAEEELENEFF